MEAVDHPFSVMRMLYINFIRSHYAGEIINILSQKTLGNAFSHISNLEAGLNDLVHTQNGGGGGNNIRHGKVNESFLPPFTPPPLLLLLHPPLDWLLLANWATASLTLFAGREREREWRLICQCY